MVGQVLIVDDDPSILVSLKVLFENAGLSVQTANARQSALDQIATTRPGVVVIDALMASNSGYAVCESIRRNVDWKDVKVILLSAKTRDIDREKGLAIGADHFIAKPFSVHEVIDKAKGLLAAQSLPGGELGFTHP